MKIWNFCFACNLIERASYFLGPRYFQVRVYKLLYILETLETLEQWIYRRSARVWNILRSNIE